MKTGNDTFIHNAESVALPWTSDAVLVANVSDFAIQLKYLTGGATVKIQCSCDQGNALSQSWRGQNINNWTDITNSATSLVEDGDITFDIAEASYRWVRVVVTGSGFVTSARFQLKGA